ncbi:hypothetical protein [Myxacorys almedinensis]|uniref:Uncharacterized protein n=1 Tax=Myxacorys almedinensis A TaxID=2690445 RepID=A0A8J7Z3X6_9CYAN|nr:hypothetical protein [Myxacorys almedinensis]NDJ17731.1 hypothetical protein [Myxacorys almedinensis A]
MLIDLRRAPIATPWAVVALLGGIAGLVAPLASAQPTLAQTAATTTCSFNSNAGTPNPLGMRTFLTIEETDGNTTFKYEQFPSPVGGTPAATIASTRQLIVYKTNLAAARQLFLNDPKYYNELRGFSEGDSFKVVNDTLTCRSTPGSTPPPTSSSRVSDLPDGNYRFWNGKASGILSDNELLKRGGVLFLFRKQGNQIVGSFGQIDNVGSCVKGTVSGNTLTGIAIPYEPSPNPASRANTSFDPGGFLKLGRWQRVGNRHQYENSTLNLANLNRINVGPRMPMSSCP